IVNIDRAMKWGFGWSHGPFEIWDAIGVAKSVERMRQEDKVLPAWIDRLPEQPEPAFYKMEKATQLYWDFGTESYGPVSVSPGILILDHWKRERGVVKKNAGASLIDLGDGILCLEFHSKVNAIGADTIQMARSAIEILEKDYEGMIIANQGENF